LIGIYTLVNGKAATDARWRVGIAVETRRAPGAG
jgi:hypothetical protein